MNIPPIGKCPFCGNEETTLAMLENPTIEKPYRVMCEGCRSMGPFEDTPKRAIERWNEALRQENKHGL